MTSHLSGKRIDRFTHILRSAHEGHAEPCGTWIVDSLVPDVFKYNIC